MIEMATQTGTQSAFEVRAPEKAYRLDIDGLRAIAVLSVVLFHAGVPFVTGGFTGVDIFFVISGYLIGGHIFSELRSGTFSYLRFYQRRAKRILPACYTVFLFTIAVAMFLLSPYEALQLGKSALAATLSASNILFWKTTGYFGLKSELNPLLMTWSLGVEEQFYLVIPLLMVLLAGIRRKWMLPAILLVCLASFGYAVYQLPIHPMMVFYMLPPRAWELGIGVALAVAELESRRLVLPRVLCQLLSVAGLVLIVFPVFLLNASMPFPGAAALPSVLGTVMLLVGSKNWINQKILSLPPLVFVGRISYSLYLWHWPLLAFGRVVYGGPLPKLSAVCLIAIAGVLSILSYYLIEQPFRKSTLAPTPLLLRYAVVSLGVMAICTFVWRSHGVQQRYPQLAALEWEGAGLTKDPCLAPYGGDTPNWTRACNESEAGRPAVAIWGDSHSAALAPGLKEAAKSEGYGFVQVGKSSCPPLLGATRFVPAHPTLAAECATFNRRAADLLEKDSAVKVVALEAYWQAPFLQTEENGWLIADMSHPREVPSLAASHKMLTDSLTATIRELQGAGKEVIVFDDVPMFDPDPLLRVRTARVPLRHMLATWLGLPTGSDPGSTAPSDSDLAASTTVLLWS